MDRKLLDRVAWISGAGSGIGRAIAQLFAKEGAAVGVIERDEALGRDVASQIIAEGGKALFVSCDVSREHEVQRSIAAIVDAFGGPQIMINNAGIVDVKRLEDSTEADWDRLMGINVKSIFFSTKHALPHLRQNPKSYIVNMASISSFVGQADTPAYTSSKGAVLQLTKSIALDYARNGIRCNCICPGITDTPMLRYHLNKTGAPEEALARRLTRVPLGISLTPEDIAKAALYLSCEDSSGITGTSLLVDAGYLAAAEWN